MKKRRFAPAPASRALRQTALCASHSKDPTLRIPPVRSIGSLLMCLNPSLERVKFVLEFLRYGVSSCVEYTRKDLPWLKELARGNEHAKESSMSGFPSEGES